MLIDTPRNFIWITWGWSFRPVCVEPSQHARVSCPSVAQRHTRNRMLQEQLPRRLLGELGQGQRHGRDESTLEAEAVALRDTASQHATTWTGQQAIQPCL